MTRIADPRIRGLLVAEALNHLTVARELLKEAGATKATERAREAISSAKGARRHADNISSREVMCAAEMDAAALREARKHSRRIGSDLCMPDCRACAEAMAP